MWKTAMTNTAADDRENPGHMYENTYEGHLAALKHMKNCSSYDAPFNEERNAAASWVCNDAQTNLDNTMACILRGTPNEKGILVRPNTKQKEFLYHFLNRLEVLELQQHIVNAAPKEPLLDSIHGFPGTGKSELIKWMRQLMEKG